MKELGEVNLRLWIKISKTRDGIEISQSHYIEKILKTFNQFDVRPA